MLRRFVRLPLLTAASLAFLSIETGKAEAALPRVASINLCTDQLLLSLAEPAQIASLSWLSADPNESMLAADARRYPLNYGSAEEILRAAPDIVLGGIYTSAFTRAMLENLGYTIVSIAPATSVADIERNLKLVATAIGREAAATATIADMRARIARIEAKRGHRRTGGIVVRPGGFTVGGGTLANELMHIAGIDNIAARDGLDVWGSLSLESLIAGRPELLIFSGYRESEPSLANAFLDHPVVSELLTDVTATTIEAPQWTCGAPASIASAESLATAIEAAGR